MQCINAKYRRDEITEFHALSVKNETSQLVILKVENCEFDLFGLKYDIERSQMLQRNPMILHVITITILHQENKIT